MAKETSIATVDNQKNNIVVARQPRSAHKNYVLSHEIGTPPIAQ